MKQKKRFGPGTGKFRLTAKTAPAILISDLHLTPESPETLAYFHRFLESLGDIDSLYVLGDLFEYWLGDDACETLGHSPVENALKYPYQYGDSCPRNAGQPGFPARPRIRLSYRKYDSKGCYGSAVFWPASTSASRRFSVYRRRGAPEISIHCGPARVAIGFSGQTNQ